jgi:hypothetical protein
MGSNFGKAIVTTHQGMVMLGTWKWRRCNFVSCPNIQERKAHNFQFLPTLIMIVDTLNSSGAHSIQYIGVRRRCCLLCLSRELSCRSNSSTGQIVLLARALHSHARNDAGSFFSGNNFMAGTENYVRCMPLDIGIAPLALKYFKTNQPYKIKWSLNQETKTES